MKKICIVTGTRAEYGLLRPLIKRINEDKDLILQLVVTGMHLSPEFGSTYNEIIKDGFEITEKVEMLLSSDTEVGTSKSMGLAMISFSELFERIKPDMLVVLGDRYEIFAVASVSMIFRIPIAHIHGGETTEGAIDEAMRHSITKMSYLHFTSSEVYRKRVIQLGEEPSRVYNVGAIGEECIKTLEFMDKKSLERDLGIEFDGKVGILTFHPTTLENNSSEEQFKNILEALEEIKELKIIFTKSNSDANGKVINKMIEEFVLNNPKKCVAFTSLGQLRYLSAMKYCDVVIGNSSSGVIEAPILCKPTVNIGDRQRGRVQVDSIVDCKPIKDEIIISIRKVLSKEFSDKLYKSKDWSNEIYTSKKIASIIKEYLTNEEINIKKKFYDL
ncbi:UDP-N-acetylglucosamine 2-epimerase [Clostridium beijerinckii]|uniref:UDP-N-acetylglucosamine 2-epimerase n=1 Tax=Clostridium beijerinckii TaxID=1520 RepID=UPI001570D6B4|nr:UDP-N-acetylglucosamine 2-epimerase [Clostridium beijerinckii]NRT73695.1 GDP/UDP-N,N'-diacetylbacillosamine 2-epimerase (hydrolysing) [Clostridium beijerinckii]